MIIYKIKNLINGKKENSVVDPVVQYIIIK